MKELMQHIERSCAQYRSKVLDNTAFKNLLNEIPAERWQEKESALSILDALVNNEDLFAVCHEKRDVFSEFFCDLLPAALWKNEEIVFAATELLLDNLHFLCDGLNFCDVREIFTRIPEDMWKDGVFEANMTDLICSWASIIEDLDSISELIPQKAIQTENDLRNVILKLFNQDERNGVNFYLYPEEAWESDELIFLMLSFLQEALENDRSGGTMYPNFRGSDADYIEQFLDRVPDRFKSDKNFVLEFLGYDYFCDACSVVYEWADPSLWEDKEFVLPVLELDCQAVIYVTDELASDPEFCDYIHKNIDLGWELQYVPEDKIPQWIKDWKE